MIQVSYNEKQNTVIIEFSGKIDVRQVEQHYPDVQKAVPKAKKGFKLLTDFTRVEEMNLDIQGPIKKTMDFLNQQGVKKIVRVIPDPAQDVGFSIMSLFHYSKEVKFLTVVSRQEAEELLQ